MSSAAMKWARSQQMPNNAIKSMLNAIAARADNTGMTFASQQLLAEDMGCSDRTVRKLLAQLEFLGVIERRARSNGRTGRSSDRIVLMLDQTFRLTKGDLVSNRKNVPVAGFQPETYDRATGTRVPGNNINNIPPLHRETFSNLSKGTYAREDALPSAGADDWLPDLPSNVVPFRKQRGAA